MIALKRWLVVAVVFLSLVLVALVAVGGSPSAYRLPWAHTLTPVQSLQSRLDSSLRTAGVEATVTTRGPQPYTVILIFVDVPNLDSYDKLDPYRAMNAALERFPRTEYLQVTVQERQRDGTFEQRAYLWDASDNRVGVHRGTYDPAFHGDQGGTGIGYVDGMTPGVMAKTASGKSAPRLSDFPEVAP